MTQMRGRDGAEAVAVDAARWNLVYKCHHLVKSASSSLDASSKQLWQLSQPSLLTSNGQPHVRKAAGYSDAQNTQIDTMINAFLVFNGSGQPRLTKFYTQLASLSLSVAHPTTAGHHCDHRES